MITLPKRRLIKLAIIAASILVAAYLVGFYTHQKGFFPASYIVKAHNHIRQFFVTDSVSGKSGQRLVWSIFLPLQLQELPVPVVRDGAGGGLTSIGEDLLLLTHEGGIFLISGTDVIPTQISPADNGFSEYAKAAEGKYAHLTHRLHYFRYIDILYYESSATAGLLVSYTEWLDDAECYGTAVARLPLSLNEESIANISAGPEDWEVIFRTQPCLPLKESYRAIEGNIAGGRMAFLAPDKVILGSGDYHWDGTYAPVAYAQDPESDYGKIIEIDVNTGHARHISIGNRNVQGILVDKAGQVWAVEHGPRGGDELNKILDGKNYGWPLATLGTRYNKLPVPSAKQYGRHDLFTPPVYAWLPSIGISNITQIDGFDPSWDGDFLVSSLKAQTLFRMRLKQDRVVFAESIKLGRRIRYAHQHSDGRIIIWTDAGTLIFIDKADHTPSEYFIQNAIEEMSLTQSRKGKLTAVIDDCSVCHSFSVDDNEMSPSLVGIFGRPVASSDYPGYSEALKTASGNWTATELRLFLQNPDEYAPGTTMPDPNIPEESMADLIEILRRLAETE